MFALFAPLTRLFALRPAVATAGVARRLMESAGARSDARQAEELRSAAYAYLRVVR
ncbi:hypothetical protein [Caenimonas aquaedulcis]|uniref:Uncharacterized protein n=1 Tax=Caenimonas aquaedulcis TaxID=2793270 RepID=A0A931MHT9_9BURK|nr:hypothetical protein [Caenimonas aquaedulcis]MBG9389119.1 hypothetical protein [Caenimonas aquaedulcis]